MPSTSQSFSYSFYSSSSTSTNGGATQRAAYAERSVTDENGTRTERVHQLPGRAPVYESSEHPGSRRVTAGAAGSGSGSGAAAQGRIMDVTDVAEDDERSYEEKMEDEYAKREGGA